MRKLGNYILLAIALLMISTVTIFNPSDITQNVLLKLIPERKTEQEEFVTVRLTLDKPVVPGADGTTFNVAKVNDLAGNVLSEKSNIPVVASEAVPPTIEGSLLRVENNQQSLYVVFNEPLIPDDAEQLGNYALECPVGTKVDLSKAKIDYDPDDKETFTTKITFSAPKVAVGSDYEVSVSKVRDVGGNTIASNSSHRSKAVSAEAMPLPKIEKLVQDLENDPTGRTIVFELSGTVPQGLSPKVIGYANNSEVKPDNVKLLPDADRIAADFKPELLLPGEESELWLLLEDRNNRVVLRMPPQRITPFDTESPRITELTVTAIAGKENDEVVITFDEAVVQEDAEKIDNYNLKTRNSKEADAEFEGADLADSEVEYDPDEKSVTIKIKKANLHSGDDFRFTISNIRDVSGNTIAEPAREGKVGGDNAPPIVKKIVQLAHVDETGATVHLRFDDAVVEEEAESLENYSASGGSKPILAELQADKETAEITFSKPVIPGETTVNVKNITDLAGNKMEAEATNLPVICDELIPPTIIRHQAYAKSGARNDFVNVTFSEPVVPSDAENIENFRVKVLDPNVKPLQWKPVPIEGCGISYDPKSHTTTIILNAKNAPNLQIGHSCAVFVSNVRDLGGNRIVEDSRVSGTVEGDSSAPFIVKTMVSAGEGGADLDLRFSEPVDRESVENKENYTVETRGKPIALQWAKLLDDGRTVQLNLDLTRKLRPTKSTVWLILVAVVLLLTPNVVKLIGKEAVGLPIMRVLRIVSIVAAAGVVVYYFVQPSRQVDIRVHKVQDLAGNVGSASVGRIYPADRGVPRVVAAKVDIGSTLRPASIVVKFSKEVDAAVAEDTSSFTLECPPGNPYDLSKYRDQIVYDPDSFTTTIDLGQIAKSDWPSDEYKLSVSAIKGAEVKGKIVSDFEPPEIIDVVQNLDVDLADLKERAERFLKSRGFSAGKKSIVDVTFSEPVDPRTAQDVANYRPDGMKAKLALIHEDKPNTVRLVFTGVPIPGETTILFRNIKDLAGNVMDVKSDVGIKGYDDEIPVIERSQANAVSGIANDAIIITFSKELVPADVTKAENYTIESPIQKKVVVGKITYNAPTSTATITLDKKDEKTHNLIRGNRYRVTVSGLRDISGNKIPKNSATEGIVRGDSTAPRLVSDTDKKFHDITLNTRLDRTGKIVDVRFDEAMNEASATDPANYTVSSGAKILSAELIEAPDKPADKDILDAIEEINPEETYKLVEKFASMPENSSEKSRIPGFEGNREAYELINERFKEIGLRPKTETFKVTVPIDIPDKTKLVVLDGDDAGAQIKLFCVWPNKVKTSTLPPEGVTGHIIYAGKGELEEYNDKDIDDSIVLMDFDCGMNYMNARMLGAEAIIFFDNGAVSQGQAYDKFIEVPADIPRFYVEKKDAQLLEELAKSGGKVKLTARMDWEEVETWNVFGTLQGESNDLIIVESYYDSISVVPRLAPGAENACGIAALLQIAELLTDRVKQTHVASEGVSPEDNEIKVDDTSRFHTSGFLRIGSEIVSYGGKEDGKFINVKRGQKGTKPFSYPEGTPITEESRLEYSIMFLATSGHFEGLEGINDFVYHHLRRSDYFLERMARKDLLYTEDEDESSQREGYRFKVFIALDLSSHNDQVAAFAEGAFYNWSWRTDNYKQNALAPFAKKFAEYKKEVFPDDPTDENARFLNAITPSKRSWRHYMATPLGLDHEAVTWVGHFGIALATAHDLREWVDTPADTIENIGVTTEGAGEGLRAAKEAGEPRPSGTDNDLRNFEKTNKQIQTIAALLLKANKDEKFFPDSKLELRDWGHALKGNIVWFDRSVNFFVPKAPIHGAVVTYEQTNSTRSQTGVRTLLVTKTAEKDPKGGDEVKGFEIEPITSDARRVLVRAWAKDIKDISGGSVTVESRYGEFKYPLRYNEEDDEWQTKVNLAKRIYGWSSIGKCAAIFLPIAALAFLLSSLMKNMSKGGRYFLSSIGVVACLALISWSVFVYFQYDPDIKEDPNKSWEYCLVKEIALFPGRAPSDHGAVTDGQNPEIRDPRSEISNAIVLNKDDDGNVNDVDVSYGNFAGQFHFRIRRRRWSTWVNAYKINEENGKITFAPDRGNEGHKTYSMIAPYGWWETQMLEVLFPCRALSVFDTVDSRYLSALDYATVLGENDAPPQWYGIDQVVNQSRREGKTTEAVVVYARPGEKVKVLMSTGLLGVKYLLTKAPEKYFENPIKPSDVDTAMKAASQGKGYNIDDGVIYRPSFVGTRDMWIVDEVRMKELERYGIKDNKVWGLHDQAKTALEEAQKYWDREKYDKFISASRESWGLEARGYPDVKRIANDTVKGIVFYFMLLLPFSFFGERLLFGFADVRNRILGFSGIFVAVFLILRFVHPAFKLSSSPYIIFLAFVIFALGGSVLFFVISKFNQEVQKIKRAAAGMHEVDVGRLSASVAAVALGISNLRKRKVRTTLTAITLILLTFTVLSFTSVNTSLKFYKLPRDNMPPYQGALVRHRSWKGLQTSVFRYLESAFEERIGSLNINTATNDELKLLPGVSDSIARGIISYRESIPESVGGIKDLEELENEVEGIDEDVFYKMKPYLSLTGKSDLRLTKKATVIPRAWRMAKQSTEREYVKVEKLDPDGESSGKVTFPNAIIGLTPKEVEATRCDQFLMGEKGRWFRPGDTKVCILPNDMANLIDITVEDIDKAKDKYDDESKPKIQMLGSDFTVIGIIDAERFNKFRDMDDEKLTPVDTVSESARMREIASENPDLQAAEPIESFIHLEASNIMLMPYQYVMDIGGKLHSVAITSFKEVVGGKIQTKQHFTKDIEEFMSRVALTVFVGEGDNVVVYSSIGATSLRGFSNLLIPILIAALIVLNTMMGAVYERYTEIGIYSSVGLAPNHIAALFLAEAAVFATVGAVMGYLIGQVGALGASNFDLLASMNLNYSSLSAISSTIIVMATVILSTLYPAKKASDMAVPDVTRKWKFPEPKGDEWMFDFPFTVGGAEIIGMYAYLARVFDSYGEGSTGGFVAEDVDLSSSTSNGETEYKIAMKTWLAPYDLGISQDVTLDAIATHEHNVYRVEVTLHRISGDVASWRRINRGFLNVLRKRFLVWRTIAPEEKYMYDQEGKKILGLETVAEQADC